MSARARSSGLARRASGLAVHLARRGGLLPAGTPDRLADDETVLDGRIEQTVMVYFPDTRHNLYQLRQWYGPLRALDQRHPVIVVMQDSRAAKLVRAELGLPVVVVAHYGRLDELLSRSQVKLALYVNHNPQNFSALRFTSLVHVFLNHGESDKGVSVSNQGKAYDFCFVAGQAAVDRIAAHTMLYDAAARCVTIGRPQIDFDAAAAPRPPVAGRRSAVLYAPTWEGAQPSLSYGSVASHGRPLVAALLADPRFAVHYRPHPLNGLLRADYGDADAQIRRLIEDAAAADPAAGHRTEVTVPLAASFDAADLLVCDVSAVATDWLPTQRPLVIAVPAGSGVATAGTRLLDVAPRLPVSGLASAASLVAEQVERDPGRADRLALIDYYLGDTTPGASTGRFLDACTSMIELRDREWGAAVARGAAGP